MARIAVLAGDGIGPEVTREAMKVARAAAERFGLTIEETEYDFGGDRYLATGEILPDSALEEFKQFDAIYLGAIGHPDVAPGILEKGILLKIRFGLDQYINLRPIKLYEGVWTHLKDKGPKDVDFVVVRENTEGLYVGTGGFLKKGTPDEVALQTSINTRKGVERCVRYAFEYTKKRGRKRTVTIAKRDLQGAVKGRVGEKVEFAHRERGKMVGTLLEDSADRIKVEVPGMLTLCGKTNVLTYAMDLWFRTFNEVGQADYPEIFRDYAHVDATCMWMVKNPEWFDVIVTDNMFGDIITDLGAMIQGGLGIAAGANLNPEGVSMFEPIHGSAPKYKGQNKINPLAAIASAGLMMDNLGCPKGAKAIDEAIAKAFREGHVKTLQAGADKSTTEIGDLIAGFVREGK
jgi:3-isopropylmalate dehydrogenase